jgi:S1-C subfamily serine protease
VITALGGATVSSSSTLTTVISRYHPGDKVAVTWTDSSGQTHHTTIQLANGPAA